MPLVTFGSVSTAPGTLMSKRGYAGVSEKEEVLCLGVAPVPSSNHLPM